MSLGVLQSRGSPRWAILRMEPGGGVVRISLVGGKGRPSSAFVAAGPAVLRAGLQRLATRAGLSVSDNPDAATAILRCADVTPTGRPLDLCIGHHTVTVAMSAVPDEAMWEAIRALISEALAADSSWSTVA